MNESRIEATERLRAEGRWQEASLYRDEMRRTFKNAGKSRSDAADAAWDSMLGKYPPESAPATDAEQSLPEDEIGGRTVDSPPHLARDTLWVYENLENARATVRDAPSLGAWSLLKWAREYRNRFFEQILPKAMAVNEAENGREERIRRNEERAIDEILGMLREVNEEVQAQGAGAYQ